MDMNINRERVRKLRLERSWSQEALADKAGLNLRTVQRVENQGAASLQTRLALADTFGIAPAGLDLASPDRRPVANAVSGKFLADLGVVLTGVYLLLTFLSFGLMFVQQVYFTFFFQDMAFTGVGTVINPARGITTQAGLLLILLAVASIMTTWQHGKVKWLLLGCLFFHIILPGFLVNYLIVLSQLTWKGFNHSLPGIVMRLVLSTYACFLILKAWRLLNSRPDQAAVTPVSP